MFGKKPQVFRRKRDSPALQSSRAGKLLDDSTSAGTIFGSLVETLPHVIHTERENERYTAVLESLLAKRNRTREESRLVELLTLLIEDFEKEKRYSRISPGKK